LLDSGADIDRIDADDGITPLVFAIMHGNWRVVELLLHWGARIFNIEYNLNALQVACKYGNLEIVQLFLDLWRETRLGVGLADCNGSNAIDYAVWFGHIEVVRLLLDHGASI
jgi:ankyrin repeat protein